MTSLLILPFYKQCIVDKIYTHHVSYETSKNAHSMFQKSLDPKMSHQTIVMGFFHQQIPYGTLRHAQSFLFEQVTIMPEVSILRHLFIAYISENSESCKYISFKGSQQCFLW